MQITADQARRWATIFPRHPAAWLIAAALLAIVLVRRPAPDSSSASVSRPVSRPADTVDRAAQANRYAWLSKRSLKTYQPLAERLAPPAGFQRVTLTPGSFGDWLRHLPCLPEGMIVLDGRGKPARPAGDPAIAAVID